MDAYIKLKTLNLYLKKAINTKISEETLKRKLVVANELYTTVLKELGKNREQLPATQIEKINTNVVQWYQEIVTILQSKFEKLGCHKYTKQLPVLPYSFKVGKLSGNNMAVANNTFDIKTATALVQPYNGEPEALESFLDSTNLLGELMGADNQPMCVKFLRTRLTGKARMGLPENLASIQALVENVKTRCATKATPADLMAKLKATKQKGNLKQFCAEVEDICAKLHNMYLSKQVPEEVASTMTTEAGVETLVNGVNNQKLEMILRAGSFATVSEAIQKINKNSNETRPNGPTEMGQIFAYNSRRPFRGGGRPNRGRFQNYRMEQRRNHNQNFHTQNLPNQSYNRQGNFSREQPTYRNLMQRGRGSNFNTNARRVYTANALNANEMQGLVQNSFVQSATPQQQQNQNNFLGQPTLPLGQTNDQSIQWQMLNNQRQY